MTQAIEAKLRIRLLGCFELSNSRDSIYVPAANKASALLAYLAIEPGKAFGRKRLATLLWGDRGEEQARNSLRQALRSIKKELDSLDVQALDADRETVRLRPELLTVDLLEFEDHLQAGEIERPAELYKGQLLGDFSIRSSEFETWLEEARRCLDGKAISLFDDLADRSSGATAVSAARQLVSLDPLREASHRKLMTMLSQAGERDLALRQFEACCKLLLDELRVKPEPETRALYEKIASANTGEGALQTHFRALAADWREQRTVLVVMPFDSLAGGDEAQMLADGVSEDLITELARYKHLLVVGNRISSHYKDRDVSLEDIRHSLGADFLVEGSVRVYENRVRIAVKLIDLTTGENAWAERFDRELVAVLDLQDEIVTAIVARLAFNLDEAANRQRQRDQKTSGSVYTLFLRARFAWRNGKETDALEFARKATEIDPAYARAHAYVAYFYAYSCFSQWHRLSNEEVAQRAHEALEKALSLDKNDPFILQRAAMTLLMLGESNEALRYADLAHQVSACDSEILIIRGLILACCSRYEEGLALLERAVKLERRLSPGCFCALSEGKHLNRDYSGSLAVLELIIDPPYYIQFMKAANLARLGQTVEAKRIVAAAPADFDTKQFALAEARMCALPEDKKHWLESFRLAGVEV